MEKQLVYCYGGSFSAICGGDVPLDTIKDQPENISASWFGGDKFINPLIRMKKRSESKWRTVTVTQTEFEDVSSNTRIFEYFSIYENVEFNQIYEFSVYLPRQKLSYQDSSCWCKTRVRKPDQLKDLRSYPFNESHYRLFWDPAETYGVPLTHYSVWSSPIDNDTVYFNYQSTKETEIIYPVPPNQITRVRVAAETNRFSSFPKDILIRPNSSFTNGTVSEQDNPIVVGVLGGFIGLLLLFFLAVIFICIKRRRSNLNTKAHLMMTVSGCSSNCPLELHPLSESMWNQEMNSLYGGGFVSSPPDPFDDDDSFDNVTKIPENNIRFLRFLGSGAFGKVWEGWVKISVSPEERYYRRVALKVRNPSALSEEDFKREALLMFKYKHPNLVQLIGVSFGRINNQLQCLLLEMMEQGNLRQYLHEARPKISAAHMRRAMRHGHHRLSHPVHPTASVLGSPTVPPHSAGGVVQVFEASLDLPNLMTILRDIANGCQYLEEKRYVHRDIAARNCLVSHRHPSGRIVKISDFGLARDIYRNDYYRKQNEPKLPVRWMSPEAIRDGNFSVKSDVWSFAVAAWEVMTLGMDPFYGHRNREVINKILGGYVLEKPENCPPKLYDQFLLCWSRFPDMRPSFKDLAAKMDEFCELSHDKDTPFSKPFFRRLPIEAVPRTPPSYDNSNSVVTEQTIISNNNQASNRTPDLMTTSLEFERLPRLPSNIMSTSLTNSPSTSIATLPRRKGSETHSSVTKESLLLGNIRSSGPHYLNVVDYQEEMSASAISSPPSFSPDVEMRSKDDNLKDRSRVVSH